MLSAVLGVRLSLDISLMRPRSAPKSDRRRVGFVEEVRDIPDFSGRRWAREAKVGLSR